MARSSQRPSAEGKPPTTAPPAGDLIASPRPRWLVEWGKSVAVALVLWLLIRAVLVEGVYIPSGSMEGTLLVHDFLFVNKALYGAEVPLLHKKLPSIRDPERGDIVMFDSPVEPGVKVVKRIIGVPGDTVAMYGGAVRINGAALDEPYALYDPARDKAVPEMRPWQLPYLVHRDPQAYRPTLHEWGPLVVPPDSFLVMGDNRDESYDSRYWGFLGRDRITGRPWFIYYSYEQDGALPLPFITGIRWGRIFSSPN